MFSSGNLNIERRQRIRRTWAGEAARYNMSVIFHLGIDSLATKFDLQLLHEESRDNQDILQQRFIDNYQNLTSKPVVQYSLRFLHEIFSVKSSLMLFWSKHLAKKKPLDYIVKGK